MKLTALRILFVILTIHLCCAFTAAQEMKPVFTLKIASPNQLVAIGETFADIGKTLGVEEPEFTNGIQEVKKQLGEMKNVVNADNDFAFTLNLNFDRLTADAPWDVFEPVVFLPITDLPGAIAALGKIPGMEMVPATVAMFMKKDGDKYTFESMFMPVAVYAKQSKDGLAVGITDVVFTMDGSVKTLLKELEPFTIGAKIDLTDVKHEPILKVVDAFVEFAHENLDADIIEEFLWNIGLPGATVHLDDDLTLEQKQVDSRKPFQTLLNELQSVRGGFTFDPKTRDTEFAFAVTPQKGGELEKMIAGRKNAQTLFNSFKATPEESVYHFNIAYQIDPTHIAVLLPLVESVFENSVEGFIEEMDDAGIPITGSIRSIAGSFRKIVESTLKRGSLDYMEVLHVNGVQMMGLSLAETGELQKIVQEFYDVAMRIAAENDSADELQAIVTFFSKDLRLNESTIEGFKVSSFNFSFAELVELGDAFGEEIELPQAFQKLTLAIFWAVKENEAVALAYGLDFAETEKIFKKALAGVKGKAPVQHPFFSASLKNYGKGVEKFMPLLEEMFAEITAEEPIDEFGTAMLEMFKTLSTELAKSDKDFPITLSQKFPDNGIETTFKMPGKVIDLFVPLLQPVIKEAREAANRMQCNNHLRMITLALHNYHDTHGELPPLYTIDNAGRPMHSWRVLLLPYMEEAALFEKIRLDEPWNSEHNSQFHDRIISVYSCPNNEKVKGKANCTYSAIAGEGLVPAKVDSKSGQDFGAIVDGTSNTLAFVEVKEPFCWMDPKADVSLAELGKGINVEGGRVGSFHPGGCNVGFFDGSVRRLDDATDGKTLMKLGVRNAARLMPAIQDF
jgi:prepilin-type processing-associated H-X9-DG protein